MAQTARASSARSRRGARTSHEREIAITGTPFTVFRATVLSVQPPVDPPLPLSSPLPSPPCYPSPFPPSDHLVGPRLQKERPRDGVPSCTCLGLAVGCEPRGHQSTNCRRTIHAYRLATAGGQRRNCQMTETAPRVTAKQTKKEKQRKTHQPFFFFFRIWAWQ